MSALGHKQTFCDAEAMSALPSKADIPGGDQHVCFVPIADIQEAIEDIAPWARLVAVSSELRATPIAKPAA
jgi:hypothetical protein